jgi:hypothetical protein
MGVGPIEVSFAREGPAAQQPRCGGPLTLAASPESVWHDWHDCSPCLRLCKEPKKTDARSHLESRSGQAVAGQDSGSHLLQPH